MEDSNVTDENLHTAIVGAEGQLYSRPITYVSSDANDLTPLTPNHFIIGQLSGQYAPVACIVNRQRLSTWKKPAILEEGGIEGRPAGENNFYRASTNVESSIVLYEI